MMPATFLLNNLRLLDITTLCKKHSSSLTITITDEEVSFKAIEIIDDPLTRYCKEDFSGGEYLSDLSEQMLQDETSTAFEQEAFNHLLTQITNEPLPRQNYQSVTIELMEKMHVHVICIVTKARTKYRL
ncbi:hypothetical protein [Colwellia sp. 12G3]|uniref:hypothetical protein n=1 Tax=Colwellia sp. 12G3 TaxID=2058299 RepID=UPI0012FEE6B7|nr:hypothetical protein [Colwellia sp. 12G3]